MSDSGEACEVPECLFLGMRFHRRASPIDDSLATFPETIATIATLGAKTRHVK